MKFAKTIHVPQVEIFDEIIKSSLYDIKQTTGKIPTVAMLKHYEYEKTFGSQKAIIHFNEVIAPSVYDFSTITSTNRYTTRWELKSVNADKKTPLTKVLITEDQGSKTLMQFGMDKLVSLFYSHQKKKQLTKLLEKIETDYQKGK